MIFWIAAVCLLVVFLNVVFWPRVREYPSVHLPSLSVLIPARNEELNLGACLETVLAQGIAVSEVLVYDDHSSDATAQVIQSFAARDPRVRLVHPRPLPPQWFGKNFACAQLATQAKSEWLLFLDADARLLPNACSRMLPEAIARKLTMLSCWPGLDALTFWESALMPMLNYVVLTLFPAPLSLRRGDPSLGLAHGACLLLNRVVYEKLGGHSSVRNEIFEDTRLARWWRQNGERSLCLDGQDVVRVRMYATLGEIWSGFQKNFFPAFRHRISFWAFLALHAAVFLAPFLLLRWRVCALVLGARLLLALRFRETWWTVLTHPLGEAILLALGLASWWAWRSGRGVEWKGRQYRATGA